MARPNEYHAGREAAAERLAEAPEGFLGCPHCLTSRADLEPQQPNYQPYLLIALKDLVRASRILAAPEEIPSVLLRSIRNAEDFLHSIDEGTDL
jgi:plasmid stabilization system protein ParE